ncbi:MAG: T9SS type A sorting domain-containing protein [candidate division WOR-3 bacterium]
MKKTIIMVLIIISWVLAIGRQDIVGYTTYDWQVGGPMPTRCRTAAVCNGIHVCWVFSNFNPANDRNLGYNYYDFTTRQWRWPTGMNIYPQRSGFGNLDYDPITGVAVASAHQSISGSLRISCAKDQAIGSGLFEYCPGPEGFSDGIVSVGSNQAIHCAMLGYNTDTLWYARIQPWCSWTTPINICSPALTPGYSSQALAASKVSDKVIIAWQCCHGVYPEPVYYRFSNDGGINWTQPIQLPAPAPGVSFHVSSLFVMFDNQDNFHIVASVSDTGRTAPAAIWHYSPVFNPPWSLVYRYAPETLAAPCGYNAIFATRPSIVQSPTTGYLYIVWEQFDSLNYEPATNLARAEIWLIESSDNGQSWHHPRPITIPNTTSKRFPAAGGVFADTLVVAYLIDSIAGFEMYNQGRATVNPVVCHFIPLPYAQIEETTQHLISFADNCTITPNLVNSQINVHYSTSRAGEVLLKLYTPAGRLVKTITEYRTPGKYTLTISTQDLKPGVYLLRLNLPSRSLAQKLIKR